MTNKEPKLELTWIGKENRPRLEPRILLEDCAKSCHAQHWVTVNDRFGNRLIEPGEHRACPERGPEIPLREQP